jgi:hypothetical protein
MAKRHHYHTFGGGGVGEVGLSYDIYLLSIFILISGHPNYYKLFLYLFERKKKNP